jgi:hypothetical protein
MFRSIICVDKTNSQGEWECDLNLTCLPFELYEQLTPERETNPELWMFDSQTSRIKRKC